MRMKFTTTGKSLRDIATSYKKVEVDLRKTTHASVQKASISAYDALMREVPQASGKLAETAMLKKISSGAWELSIGEGLYRPYHVYQNRGQYPSRSIPFEYFHGPYGGAGGAAIDRTLSGAQVKEPSGWGLPRQWGGPYWDKALQFGANVFIRRIAKASREMREAFK
jgi:hypothetical protein